MAHYFWTSCSDGFKMNWVRKSLGLSVASICWISWHSRSEVSRNLSLACRRAVAWKRLWIELTRMSRLRGWQSVLFMVGPTRQLTRLLSGMQAGLEKSHPRDFPMGVGDLYDLDRPRKVSVAEVVQHLLRYRDGRFVRGWKGQRVVWAVVNVLLLSEARQRGYAVYRSVRRRIGFGIQGGGVLTKGELRDMLKDEQSMRLVINQLMCLGRDV